MSRRSSFPRRVVRFYGNSGVCRAAPSSAEADIVFETRRKFPAAKVFKAHKKIGFSQIRFEEI